MKLGQQVPWIGVILLATACGRPAGSTEGAVIPKGPEGVHEAEEIMTDAANLKKATFGAGCFWCVEAVFQRLEGVEKVVSGYSGGHVEDPTYEQVCSGRTGHAEVCQIAYDPAKITFDQMLEVFWKTHDPTTRDRQGNDVGPQYRSVIYYHDAGQKELAERYKARLEAERIWNRPIVTEIAPFEKFWPAEAYHQNYYNNNPNQGYCSFVITPKIEKLRKIFRDRLKK
ncbi:MAG: peptide-methionine (S)-S-oxide reductase MsrA [Acidobacteria bacterium]|nr:peptide-methionine (S)-S-oxide reductase MsrA [Acidobacteriota bacterium]